MIGLFYTLIYEPIYNLLVFLIGLLPTHDVGLAVVVTTVIVKLILLPLSKKAARTQAILKELEGEVEALKQKHKEDKAAQAKAMMELYRSRNVSPFTMFWAILVQIPIVIALYLIFYKGGFPGIDTSLLYAFVSVPEKADMLFLGFLDMAGKSWPLALLAGATQFIQAHFATPALPPRTPGAEPSFKEDFARSMSIQVRFVLPVIIVFIAHSLTSAVALYWVASNVFTIIQDWWIRRTLKAPQV
ncbi:MAG TPA: YidC/Oxa1 family membrane protein insertase [Candidatus Paceibacterota bacterium]|nr:YidC/Oxa1 family membrane protein insertase [Candidatus Paceibacterota bacterium]